MQGVIGLQLRCSPERTVGAVLPLQRTAHHPRRTGSRAPLPSLRPRAQEAVSKLEGILNAEVESYTRRVWMPRFKPVSNPREQIWLFPPTLDELVPAGAEARLLSEAMDELSWAAFEQ